MTVLVTGASGFIGRHLVARLLARGDPVRAVVRSAEAAATVRDRAGAADIVTLDPTDVGGLRAAARGCGRVVHLAGPYRGSGRDLVEAHVHGTARLLAAVPDGARVVYVSSVSVYGFERPWPADVTTPPDPWTVYGAAKVNAERQVRRWGRGATVIVRPTITYGPGDDGGMIPRLWRLLNAAGGRRALLPGDGRNRIHLLHIDDLGRGLLAALDRGEGTYIFAGPAAVPVAEIAEYLATASGVPAPRFAVPPMLARTGGLVLEGLWRLGIGRSVQRPEPPVTAHGVDVLTRDRAFNWARAEEGLGWRPEVPLDAGLRETAAWLASSTTSAPAGRAPAPAPASPDNDAEATGASPRPAAGAGDPGPPWRRYREDPDEGLGTVYERFRLAEVIDRAMARLDAHSVLHAPAFGMTGLPGLDCVFQARDGHRVGVADVSPDRLAWIQELWAGLDLPVDTTLLPWPDTSGWADALPDTYDLVVSFAALWWCADPWDVLAAQARAARRGVLVALSNPTPAMALRQKLWHKDMFAGLNLDVIDPERLRRWAVDEGLVVAEEGFFDLPPFPDTSVPIRQVLTAGPLGRLRRSAASTDEGVWRWSILPYLHGEEPDLPQRMERLAGVLETRVGPGLGMRLAHHRYVVLAHPQ